MLLVKFRQEISGGGKTDSVTIVAIAKNEMEYIREWVAFHKAVGISKIYLYDNDSTDLMLEQIRDFINEGFVIVRKISGSKRQYDAYNDALNRFGSVSKYMAFIDCDEFLLPVNKDQTIESVLDKLINADRNVGGVAVNWVMYGSSGYVEKPEGLLIEKFIWRADTSTGKGNRCVKSIVVPSCVKKFGNPHYPRYKFGFYGVSTSGDAVSGAYNPVDEYVGLRINHYFTKSKEQWIARRSIGMADKDSKRTLEEFYLHDNNDVKDDSALVYSEIVKRIMNQNEI